MPYFASRFTIDAADATFAAKMLFAGATPCFAIIADFAAAFDAIIRLILRFFRHADGALADADAIDTLRHYARLMLSFYAPLTLLFSRVY